MIKTLLTLILVFTALPVWALENCRASRIETLCANITHKLIASIQVRVDRSSPIMAVSFVNLHNMEQTSELGRILSEEVTNNFFQFGYTIVEARLREETLTTHKESGEFALSRQIRHLAPAVDVQAILSGTYAIADDSVAVSTRVVDARTKALLAAAHCHLRLTPEVARLMQHPSPPTQARYPTRLLQLGNRDDATQIQGKLYNLGFYTGRIDGRWGKGSRAALGRFRASMGLPSHPHWDMETQKALLPDL